MQNRIEQHIERPIALSERNNAMQIVSPFYASEAIRLGKILGRNAAEDALGKRSYPTIAKEIQDEYEHVLRVLGDSDPNAIRVGLQQSKEQLIQQLQKEPDTEYYTLYKMLRDARALQESIPQNNEKGHAVVAFTIQTLDAQLRETRTGRLQQLTILENKLNQPL